MSSEIVSARRTIQEKERFLAAQTYQTIYNPKTQTISEQGTQLLKSLSIPEEKILPQKLSEFKLKLGDQKLAELHHRNYCQQRQKALLRIASRLSCPKINTSELLSRHNSRQKMLQNDYTQPQQSPSTKFDSCRVSSFGTRRSVQQISEMKLRQHFEKIDQIEFKRKKLDKQASHNHIQEVQERRLKAASLVERQREKLLSFQKARIRYDRQSYLTWRNQINQTYSQYGSLNLSNTELQQIHSSRSVQRNPSTSQQICVTQCDKSEAQISDYFQKFDERYQTSSKKRNNNTNSVRDKARQLNLRVDQIRSEGMQMSILHPDIKISLKDAQDEQASVRALQKQYKKHIKLVRHHKEQKQDMQHLITIRKESNEAKQQHIQDQRKEARKKLREQEKQLSARMLKSSDSKKRLLSTENTKIRMKQASEHLRNSELQKSKTDIENDRQFRKSQTIGKLIQIEEQHSCKFRLQNNLSLQLRNKV